MKVNLNPTKKGHYKRECHRLMDEIWGDSKAGRAQAYFWLKASFGRDVHFSEIHDEKRLKEIWEKLWVKSFEFEPIRIYSAKPKLKKDTPPDPESKKQQAKKKYYIAPNALELQRNHRPTIVRRPTLWNRLLNILNPNP